MSWRITFEIIGETFSPNRINLNFNDQNEPNEIAKSGKFKGTKYSYGSASYLVSDRISRRNKFKHLADTFEPLLAELKEAGADNWHITIDRMYSAQCNEELGSQEIIQIARLKCPVAYSAFQVSEEEESEGFNKRNYEI
jgi:hypothetical protein